MTLRPVHKETGFTKKYEEYSPGEMVSHVNQTMDNALRQMQLGRAVDTRALDQAEAMCKLVGDSDLLDRLNDTRLTLGKGPQPVAPPPAARR